MAKFSGIIGFSVTEETSKGVWTDRIVEKRYFGDLIRSRKRWTNGESINDNLTLSNEISIVLDAYLSQHLGEIKYVELNNSKWKVTDLTIEHPRVNLTIGGVWNG